MTGLDLSAVATRPGAGTADALLESVRAVLTAEWSAAAVRAAEQDRRDLHGLWERIGALGWLDLLVPEEVGGAGLDAMVAGRLAEELGRHLVPGPLLETIVGRAVLARLGALDGVSGLLTLAVAEPDSDGLPAAAGSPVVAGRVTGTKVYVPFADEVDTALATVRTGADSVLALLTGVQAATRPHQGFDLAGRPCTVDLSATAATMVGADHDEAPTTGPTSLMTSLMTMLTAARLTGVAGRLLAASVEHATVRRQFGAPIATFQAVRHRIAGMQMRVTTAHNAWAAAAEALTPEGGGPTLDGAAAYAAKAYCSRAARQVAEDAMQVHGGIAFTAEHDLHLAVRHVVALQASWGDERHHEAVLGAELLREVRPARSTPTGKDGIL
jgi:alkylation response protein AidB-like acyl-CoA dehydrogenase